MNKKLINLFFWIAVLIFPMTSFAVQPFLGNPFPNVGPLDILETIERVFLLLIWPVTIAIIILSFMYAGILFLTGKGDPAKISIAKLAVLWGTIGVAVILLSFSIIRFVRALFPVGL